MHAPHHLIGKLYNPDGSLNCAVEEQLKREFLISRLHEKFGTSTHHELVSHIQAIIDETRMAMHQRPGEATPEAYDAVENLERVIAKIH